ncbi:hypothetical protein NERG_01167 [Nematocida ausubeli]|uniref:Uncharacterized protein n=1 Tax=Nematocida ausubeli (strain ATCC PRA-371 / ERTm2) TaxID=1913371 RepID=H8ZD20_NEMA1|nr:hypothetical protein NERG_01167 [Nematocida ausubeli]KAI5136164.1 hypothetical protein NEAUS06_1787 [Nematocida ausubeli]
MEVLTRKNNLLRINSTTGKVSVVRNNITMYKKTDEYTVLATPNYLEVLSGKKLYLSLFRKVNNVHILPNPGAQTKNSVRIYLIGDRYIEYLEDTQIQSEVETSRNINDTCIYNNIIIALQNSKITLYSKYLKKLDEIKVSMKYCEKISIVEHNGKGLVAVLSSTERRVLLIYGKEVAKDISVSKQAKNIKIVTWKDKPMCLISEGNAVRVVSAFDEEDRIVETEHISNITQIEYKDNTVYTISSEGIVCSFSMDETLATAIYVDAEGLESIGV